MRLAGKVVWFLTLAVLAPSLAFAQAQLAGVVKDTSGAVLPGVTVEAASPALIERVRTATTDGTGRYQIVDLRPGTYTVTFTLPGFNTVKRDGFELTGTATVTVDADMKVGAVTETITVTGESPLVDVTSVKKQAVIDHDTIQSLPSTRQYYSLAKLVPGTSGGGTDVSGTAIADVGQSITVHGSKNVDQRVTLNGLNIMTLQAGGNIGGQQPDVGSAAEVTVDTSSLSAEMSTGGIRINFIPKDGGNTFSNSTFFTFSNNSMQANNYTDELKAAGLATPNAIDNNWDLNESVGGPIVKDKVWFWFSTRFNRANTYAGVFNNLNAFNPAAWTYQPDTNSPSENRGRVQQNNLRFTWQATPKAKVAFEQKVDSFCNCPNNISATIAPESGRDRRFPRLRQEHLEFTSPVTSKLMFEAVFMHLFERWGNMELRSVDDGGSLTDPQAIANYPLMISALEQSNNLTYRSNIGFNNTVVPNYTYRVAASYVTGTHAFKTGWNDTFGYLNQSTYAPQPFQYRFNNGVANQVTQYAYPYTARSEENHDFGAFAQDSIHMNKATVNLAIRYDWFKTGFPAQTLGAGTLVPNRNLSFPEQDNLNWKDLSYRTGFAYDLRGDGKTAIKVAANKYLLGQTLNLLGSDPNPVNALQQSTTRAWTDSNRDFVPQCDFTNNLANGECAQVAQLAFGSPIPGQTFDPDLISGWNHRQSNWEISAGVQQELPHRVAVDVSYYRRIWAHFRVTDNTLLSPSDFTQFSMVVPADSRLPGGGGYTVNGIYDVLPTKFGQSQLYNTLSDKVGNMTEHWNGVDFTLNGRLSNGLNWRAGVSTGRETFDVCDVVSKLPEMLANTGFTGNGNGQLPAQFCSMQEPWLTAFKAFAAYVIPKIDVQTSASYANTPVTNSGISSAGSPVSSGVLANFVATNAYLAANSTLGRNIAGGGANTTIQIVDPNAIRLNRDQGLNVRVGKVLRYHAMRSTVNLDLFNILNRSTILTANQAYASWLRPTSIVNARVMKVSFTVDLK